MGCSTRTKTENANEPTSQGGEKLTPMFYYFGRKGRLAASYPAPAFPLVIEPFAGSMAYALHHRPEKAIGIEIDSNVANVWHRLTGMSAEHILALSEPRIGERTTDRFAMLAAGSHGTARASSYLWTDRMSRDFQKQKRLAAKHVDYARTNVQYVCNDYRAILDIEATWFIDPPYQHVERGYDRSNVDYDELAEWCKRRRGQVIVCEQDGADWLPFQPLCEIRGTTNKRTVEMVWAA